MRKPALLLGLVLASIASPQAAIYQDIDAIPEVDRLINRGHNRSFGFFDIVNGDHSTVTIGSPYYTTPQTWSDIAGFIPGHESVDSISAWFYFRDNNNDAKVESVRIGLDWYDVTHSTTLANQTFTIFGGDASGAIQALEVDGVLKYNIIRVDGDFFFDFARLEVETHVPEGGGTAMLLGMGVIAMGAMRRRM